MFQTVYDFTLPKGFVDADGELHKEGKMRLATAADEIYPLRDPKAQQNPGYLIILILARVVIKLGSLSDEAVNERVIENLFTMDLAYLQDFYNRINQVDPPVYEGACPECGKAVKIPINFP
jgi:hypothetical protein